MLSCAAQFTTACQLMISMTPKHRKRRYLRLVATRCRFPVRTAYDELQR
jgi:hypothetical protein